MEQALSVDASKINAMLCTYPWLDCEIVGLEEARLTVVAGVAMDVSATPDLLLHFDDLFAVQAVRRWTLDTPGPAQVSLGSRLLSEHCPEPPLITVFARHAGSEARTLGLPFRLELGYDLFEFRANDDEGSCWIAARAVSITQLRKPETPLKLRENWNGNGGWQPLK